MGLATTKAFCKAMVFLGESNGTTAFQLRHIAVRQGHSGMAKRQDCLTLLSFCFFAIRKAA